MQEQKKFNTDNKIREIDISAPILHGETDDGIRHLNYTAMMTDSSKHNN